MEFAPGRVSRRYGIEHRYVRHWIEPASVADPVQHLEIGSWITEADEIGEVMARVDDADVAVRCVRPLTISAVRPPQNVLDSSVASPRWQFEVVPADEGLVADLPTPSHWNAIVNDIAFYLTATAQGWRCDASRPSR
jgi:hypothetical protein